MRTKFKRNLEKEEKRKKRNMILISAFIVGMFVLSTFAFIGGLSDGSSNAIVEYDTSFRVVSVDGFQVWQANLGGEPRQFFALPSEVAGYYTPALDEFVAAPAITIAFDNEILDRDSIAFFASQINDLSDTKQLGVGFTQADLEAPEIPVISCVNSSEQFLVMEVSLTNETQEEGLLYANNCLTLKAFTPQDIMSYIEKMRYASYGIEYEE